MKRIRLILSGLIVVLSCLSFSNYVKADELQISDVSAFLNTQDLLRPIDKELRATGYVSIFRPKALDIAQTMLPAYENNIEALKSEENEFYTRMSNVAVEYVHEDKSEPYYSSLEEWAKMGDRVMLAFYASRTDSAGDVRDQLAQQMPPGVLAFAPPETKALLEEFMSSLGSIENVSDHDKLVVIQFRKRIMLHLRTFSDGFVVRE